MHVSLDDQLLQAEFHAVARALVDEIRKAVATEEVEPEDDFDSDETEEEKKLNSIRDRQVRPEIGRLVSHLHEIGVELRARNLLPANKGSDQTLS